MRTKRVERLLNLTAALIDATIPLTSDQIRDRIPGYPIREGTKSDVAFRKRFEEDKKSLRAIGIPLDTVEINYLEQPHAAYTIRRENLPDPGLDADELAALHLAATVVQAEGLDAGDLAAGLRKLGGLNSELAAAASPVGAVPIPKPLTKFFRCILERREATFDYEKIKRRVQPYRLEFRRGHWYLTGFDVDKQAQRSFRLDRAGETVKEGPSNSYEIPHLVEGVLLRQWEIGSGPSTTARVLVDAELASAVLADDPDLRVVETRQDGAIVLELDVRHLGALRNFMLNFLDRAELLGPQHFRDDLIEWLHLFVLPSLEESK
ncbi:MAG: WYL domain-containing protein [Microthrixaceae bacterium]